MRHIFLDTETTGLNANQGHRIIEIAAIETSVNAVTEVGKGAAAGYVPPTLISRPGEGFDGRGIAPQIERATEADGTDDSKFVAPSGIDQRAAMVGGSPITGQAGTRKTSFQYTLVFDDADQMKQWWEFLRWLRGDAGYEGETIASKLMSFIDAHTPIA